ncbi:myotrophin homolog [Styela clava]|uniref:myotrophin-like n=1 Tax=Styela clava TaxID=7725 RepID=UPI001939B4EB|nr:myotrophin-like [Styela clava]
MVDSDKVLWCLKNGELDELKSQLSKPKVCVDDVSLTNNKMPAIICAADYGQTDIVNYLIEKGANVNIVDKKTSITPLLAAIWEGHTSTVELLLKKGAKNKGMKSPGGKSYIDEADNKKIKELLDKYSNN